jgi:hypothetical protein
MNLSKLVFLSFFFTSILIFGCRDSAADWFDDFESANVGDTISSLGYLGSSVFVDAQVSNVGVGGSQGFEITGPDPSGGIFESLLLPLRQPGPQNPGDSLLFQVDMQMRNGSLSGGPSPAFMLDLFMLPPLGGIISGQILRDGTLWDQYQAANLASSDFELGGLDSVSELGLIDNSIGEWSDWVTLQLLISQTGVSSFDMTTNLLDSSGTTLNSAQMVGLDLAEYFANGDMFVGISHTSDSWQIVDRFRFDNIVYSVNSSAVPEPVAATFLLLGLAGLSARRQRSA